MPRVFSPLPLADVSQEQLLKYFDEKAPALSKCQMCEHEEFYVSSDTHYLVTVSRQVPDIEGYSKPCFTVTCKNCGNMMFVSAVMVENFIKESANDKQ